MKVFSLLLVLLILEVALRNKHRLTGKYKLIPDNGKSYIIEIKDTIYTKIFSNGKTVNGVVEYGENYIYLRDYEKQLSEADSSLSNNEVKKLKAQDLISLHIKKKKPITYCRHLYYEGGPINWLDVCAEQGKVVRIK